jgi:hypothetical protein
MALQHHEMSHQFRNVHAENMAIIHGSDPSKWKENAIRGLTIFSNEVAEQIAQYFRYFDGTHDVGCCIRLKHSTGDGYATMGRSPELNESRQQDSKPINHESGLPGAMRKRGYGQAIHIPDIGKAIADGIWERTPNCKQKNVTGAMAMPINIRIKDKGRAMVGILYLTSSRSPFLYPFDEGAIEQAGEFAD